MSDLRCGPGLGTSLPAPQDPPSPSCLGRCLLVLPRGEHPPLKLLPSSLPPFLQGCQRLPPISGTWCRLGPHCPSPTAPRGCGCCFQSLGAGCGQEQGGEPAPFTEPSPQSSVTSQAPWAAGPASFLLPAGGPESPPIPTCPGQMPESLQHLPVLA